MSYIDIFLSIKTTKLIEKMEMIQPTIAISGMEA